MKALVVLSVFLAIVYLIARAVRRRPSKNEWKPQVRPLTPPSLAPQRVGHAPAPRATNVEEAPTHMAVEVSLPGLKIVGESHYQDAIEELVGGRTEESADVEVDLSLVPESDNQYDPNAVGVEIDGELVGYLSRASAKKYRSKFGALTTHEWPGRIVGGWDRGGGDRGSFGVQFDE